MLVFESENLLEWICHFLWFVDFKFLRGNWLFRGVFETLAHHFQNLFKIYVLIFFMAAFQSSHLVCQKLWMSFLWKNCVWGWEGWVLSLIFFLAHHLCHKKLIFSFLLYIWVPWSVFCRPLTPFYDTSTSSNHFVCFLLTYLLQEDTLCHCFKLIYYHC